MKTERKRIFVGNLPDKVSREDILSKFIKYGEVESVEVKHKTDPTSNDILSTFSYVNLVADRVQLDQCVKLLNGIKWDGRHIKVEIAKESFLQQLQREREASRKTEQVAAVVVDSTKTEPPKKELNKRKLKSTKKETSSSESSDSDDEKNRHPKSKLPMFRGTKLSMQQVVEEKNSDHSERLRTNQDIVNSKLPVNHRKSARILKETPKSSESSHKSEDLLKKFESFSDVWKDEDEPVNYAVSSKNYFKSNSVNNSQSEPYTGKQGSSSRKSFSEENVYKGSSRRPVSNLPNTVMCSGEEKRLKSLEEKRRKFDEQKNAVRLALTVSDIHRVNKKVVFDDDYEQEKEDLPHASSVPKRKERWTLEQKEQAQTGKISDQATKKTKSLSLFNDSDNEEAETGNWGSDFSVKKQFEGEKGKKLLELQTKYNNDSRFTLDERFYESDDESNKTPSFKVKGKEEESNNSGSEDIAAEREQQLQILSSVLGHPVASTRPSVSHESKNKGMLRFDPTKPDHVKFELSKEEKEPKKKKKKVSDVNEEEGADSDDAEEEECRKRVHHEEKEPEPVSKDTFYTVADSLAESLKKAKEGQESGFSLLKMFGTSHVETGEKNVFSNPNNTRPLPKGPLRGKDFLNESSEDEDVNTEAEAVPRSESISAFGKPTGSVWQENFFFQPDDSRLKEGADFFKINEDQDHTDLSGFSKKREELRRIVKMKVRNNLRQANAFKTKVGDRKHHGSHRPLFGLSTHKRRRK